MGGVNNWQETQRAKHHEPLRQGDIVRFEWAQDRTTPKLGVIINADCDLAHRKTDGVIAFAPIYTFSDYLNQFWAPGQLEEVGKAAAQTILALADDTDEAALQDWLRTASPDVVAESITRFKNLTPAQGKTLKTELVKLSSCMDDLKTPLDRFRDLCSHNPNPDIFARKQIASAKKSMGDGHFFFTEIVGESDVGFVVRLRRIYTLPEHCVFASNAEKMSHSDGLHDTAFRVSQFTSICRFKIVQLFSQQYSRIGLPDELSDLGALAIDDIVQTLTGARS